jgi:rhodanese-related sulfurtransferase/CBS domain-containing protein
MPKVVTLAEVQELVGRGAKLVEVLPNEEYEWAHLPGALNIPLRELEVRALSTLDLSHPVIAYCHDLQCDLSPRAAWRFERLGFRESYDYAASKMDWIASDLPWEGTAELIGGVIDRDVSTCDLDDPIDTVKARLSEHDFCVVVDTGGVVAGTLDMDTLARGDGATAEAVMRKGPSTVRPSEEIAALDGRMHKADTKRIVVTRLDGTLLGVYTPGPGANSAKV